MSGQAGDGLTLVLLHGLGANRHVWDVVAELWDGDVYAPDFRGHGEVPWRGHYSFGAMAADVAEALQRDHGRGPYAVVGHSMGGAVGLALASGWFGPPPTHVATIGVKLRWSDEELFRIDGLAARPPRMFDDRDGAVEWFMKLSGLFGVFAPDDPRLAATIDSGVIADQASGAVGADALWRTTQDPATVGVGPPDMTGLLPAAKCPVVMALGEHDPLAAPDHHDDLAATAATNPFAAGVTTPHVFYGLGHNAMVEDPRAVAAWLATLPAFAGTS